MSSKTDISALFKKYKIFFDLIYGKITSKDILSNFLNINNKEIILNIKNDLQIIDFGTLTFIHKLQYLFMQYLTKEIEFMSNKDFELYKNYKLQKGLKNLIFPKNFKDFILDGKIKKESFKNLEIQFNNFLKTVNSLDFSLISFDIYSSKSLFLFLIRLKDLFQIIDEVLGENLTQFEKKIISEMINSIINKLKEYEEIILRKSVKINKFLPVVDLNFFNLLININGFELDYENTIEVINEVKNNTQMELEKITELYFPKKSIRYAYDHFNDQKILLFEDKKKLIQTEIIFNQKCLTNNQLFDNVAIFPLNFQKSNRLVEGWVSSINFEFITKDSIIKGIRLYLEEPLIQSSKKHYEDLTNWKLKRWVFFQLIPGNFFLRKYFSESNYQSISPLKEDISMLRWNYLLFSIFVKNGYFKEPESKFMSLWEFYYHFNILSGIFKFIGGENISEICNEIKSSTGVDLTVCTQDFYSYYCNFYQKLVTTVEILYLLQIQAKVLQDSLPMQRFVEIIIKNYYFPLQLLIQIFEKSFNFNGYNFSISELTRIFTL